MRYGSGFGMTDEDIARNVTTFDGKLDIILLWRSPRNGLITMFKCNSQEDQHVQVLGIGKKSIWLRDQCHAACCFGQPFGNYERQASGTASWYQRRWIWGRGRHRKRWSWWGQRRCPTAIRWRVSWKLFQQSSRYSVFQEAKVRQYPTDFIFRSCLNSFLFLARRYWLMRLWMLSKSLVLDKSRQRWRCNGYKYYGQLNIRKDAIFSVKRAPWIASFLRSGSFCGKQGLPTFKSTRVSMPGPLCVYAKIYMILDIH